MSTQAAALRSLRLSLELLKPAFTAPGFQRLSVVFWGWLLSSGVHAITEALVVSGVSGVRHHEAFHRLFSRGTWHPDRVGQLVFSRLLSLLPPDRPVAAVIDDTLAHKKGSHIFGIASHLDAVRSTKKRKVFSFGHCWVVLAIPIKPPFSSRSWALPVLFRLYRSTSDCLATNELHHKKTQLARAMLDVLLSWTDRPIELAADVAYCCSTVTHDLPARVVLSGAMRPDAALHLPLPTGRKQRGRPAKVGPRTMSPAQLANDDDVAWQTTQADVDGRPTNVMFKHMQACWPRVCGARVLKIVVLRTDAGQLPFRVFFCTDPSLSVPQLLSLYFRRWSIEVLFRDLKQLFGFGDSSARKKEAVLRVAPFVGLSYSMLVLWAVSHHEAIILAAPPRRPWYTHKHGLSSADILRAARRAAAHEPIQRSPLKACDLRKIPRRKSTRQISLNLAA